MQFLDDWLDMPSMAFGDLPALALACVIAGVVLALRPLTVLVVTVAWTILLRRLGTPPKIVRRFALEAGAHVLHARSGQGSHAGSGRAGQ